MKDLHFDKDGLVPVVVQEASTGAVLVLAYMNNEALEASQQTGKLHLWSRSRKALWLKGERSGNYQLVEEIRLNCEGTACLCWSTQRALLATMATPRASTGDSIVRGRHISLLSVSLTRRRYMESSPPPISASQDALEEVFLELWGAYCYLGNNDLSAVSRTSRLLHERDAGYLVARLCDELGELRGVIEGTHRHSGLPADLILEGSQVLYWTCLLAVVTPYEFTASMSPPFFSFHSQRSSSGGEMMTAPIIAREIRRVILKLEEVTGETSGADDARRAALLQEVFGLLVECCRLHGIDARDIIRHDLDEMKGRSYLQPYFSGKLGSG